LQSIPSKELWSDSQDEDKQWSESSTLLPGPPIASAFQQEVLSLAREVELVLHRLPPAPRTEAILSEMTCDEGTCTLTAFLRLEHKDRVYDLVDVAKEAIFAHTSRSRGVCLLGYKKAPFNGFKTTPTGFVAKFGSVSPKKQTCRRFYETGKCRHDCWWQHPQSTNSFRFHVEVIA